MWVRSMCVFVYACVRVNPYKNDNLVTTLEQLSYNLVMEPCNKVVCVCVCVCVCVYICGLVQCMYVFIV